MKLGLENLLEDKSLIAQLEGKKVGVVVQPASVNQKLEHTLDLIASHPGIDLACAFGPQHGARGEKQDNMIESEDYLDPAHKIPVFSLYGSSRRLTPKMMDHFDILLVDLQDVGCRIYTFLTTLIYIMEDIAPLPDKEIWVLDRPNPAGRGIEGLALKSGFESFVGAALLPMRHGLTLGEVAQWYKKDLNFRAKFKLVPMKDYDPNSSRGQGWPLDHLSWINPSPNVPRLSTTLIYPGTVLLEGTTLSEGRGTTRPLEMFGAPYLDSQAVLNKMSKIKEAWMKGCHLRTCYFEPMFQKSKGELCSGIQVHVDGPFYNATEFQPYRLVALFLKAVRLIYPDQKLWIDPPYEYVLDRMPIDILSGNTFLREWVENENENVDELERHLLEDEKKWEKERKEFLLYPTG